MVAHRLRHDHSQIRHERLKSGRQGRQSGREKLSAAFDEPRATHGQHLRVAGIGAKPFSGSALPAELAVDQRAFAGAPGLIGGFRRRGIEILPLTARTGTDFNRGVDLGHGL